MGFDAIAGGSPFNVAIGLRRLGVDASFLAGLSTDYLGRRLRAVLEKETVNTDHLIDFDAPTTLAMVAVGSDGSPTYSFRGDGCADRQLRLEHLTELDGQVRGIHVGSFSLVVQPIADTLLALVARESGTADLAGPQCAPQSSTGHSALAQPGRSVRRACAPDQGQRRRPASAVPRQRPTKKKSPKAGSASVRNWSSSLAARKAPASSPASTALVGAGKTVVTADTVGAGDTFQAALLTFLSERQLDTPQGLSTLSREILDEMLNFAVGAAALTCTKVGPDLPYRHQLG